MLVNSTEIKFLGDCEWQARKDGVEGRLQWHKMHLAMNTATSDIRAVEFTSSREGDSPVLPVLLGQITADEDIGTATADGAYDTRCCHSAVIARGGFAIIPIRSNGRAWRRGRPGCQGAQRKLARNASFRPGILVAVVGHHARSRVEAKMPCLKAFNERIAARDPDRQTAQIHIRIALVNRFNAFGTAEVVRVT